MHYRLRHNKRKRRTGRRLPLIAEDLWHLHRILMREVSSCSAARRSRQQHLNTSWFVYVALKCLHHFQAVVNWKRNDNEFVQERKPADLTIFYHSNTDREMDRYVSTKYAHALVNDMSMLVCWTLIKDKKHWLHLYTLILVQPSWCCELGQIFTKDYHLWSFKKRPVAVLKAAS